MAREFSSLIDPFLAEFPWIEFLFDEKFTDRLELRKALLARFGDEAVLRLEGPPQINGSFVSLAHCPSLGGLALSQAPVGLDIEETERVAWNVVERILKPGENKGPWPAAHWTAKEAIWKAMGDDQPTTISAVFVKSWKKRTQDSFLFQNESGRGIALCFASWTIAVFERQLP